MKKKLLTFLLMIGLMVMFIPFSADAAGGSSFDNAQQAELTKTYSGTLAQNGSRTYFKVTMKTAGKLTLKIKTQQDAWCYVYLSNKNDVVSSQKFTANNLDSVSMNVLSGTYYVVLYSYSGGGFNVTPSAKYSTQSFVETTKARDNSKATAHAIKANKVYSGHLGYNDTEDYFKISVTKKSVLKFVTCKTEGEYMDFKVINSSDKTMRYFSPKTAKTSSVTLAKGTYYIVAVGGKSSLSYNGTYSFKLSVTPVGWNKDSKGWWYMDEYGSYLAGGKKKIGSKYYFFSAGGYMQTGWKEISGDWYYFKASGEMATGWAQVGKQWYYFAPNSGYMMTGYRSIGNSYYYFASDGHMMTGWTKVYGYQHYFNSDGTEAHGWKKIGGYWYYFRPSSGTMVYGGRYTIDGRNYNFNSNGVCTNP